MKRLLIFALITILSGAAVAQNGYRIRIHLNGYRENKLLLTCYYGDKIQLINTVQAVKPGIFVFQGKKPLTGGIYMAVSSKKSKLFEFIIGKNQNFTLTTDTVNYSLDMKVSGSKENTLFFNYLKTNEKFYKQTKQIESELKAVPEGSHSYNLIKQKLDSLNKAITADKEYIIKKNPDTFFAVLLKAMEPEQVPKNPNPKDSLFAYRYMLHHYWDYFNPGDQRLMRTPIYNRKIDYYFKNLVLLQPDYVDHAIDLVISKSKSCKECMSYLVWKFTVEYQNPKYMGFDKVFVHIVDRYFAKDSIENTTPSILKMLKERANELRHLLIGKPAPDLILMDTSGQYINFRSLHHRFVLLMFWDYHCSVCKREINALKPFYKQYAKKYDLEVYGISINPDLDNWKKAVRNRKLPWINVNGTRSVKGDYTKTYNIHGTPQFFLLNSKGKIIAKHFSVYQLKLILDRNLIKEF